MEMGLKVFLVGKNGKGWDGGDEMGCDDGS